MLVVFSLIFPSHIVACLTPTDKMQPGSSVSPHKTLISLSLITPGATAVLRKYWQFKANVIVCHRKPIWLLLLPSCAHLIPRTGIYLCMWFSFRLPGEGNGHLQFSSLLSHTLGKVKMGLVYTKYLAIFGRQSVRSHQTIDWVSRLRQRLRSGQHRREGAGSSDSRDVCVCSSWQ